MKTLITLINDLIFENEKVEEFQEQREFDFNNPLHVQNFINALKNDGYETVPSETLTKLQTMLDDFNNIEMMVSIDEIKSVYQSLKNRDENPNGCFDRVGRFYVTDSELMDVRSPSAKYPHSQMNAARTAKFVKLLAAKYKCKNQAELEKVAFS